MIHEELDDKHANLKAGMGTTAATFKDGPPPPEHQNQMPPS